MFCGAVCSNKIMCLSQKFRIWSSRPAIAGSGSQHTDRETLKSRLPPGRKFRVKNAWNFKTFETASLRYSNKLFAWGFGWLILGYLGKK